MEPRKLPNRMPVSSKIQTSRRDASHVNGRNSKAPSRNSRRDASSDSSSDDSVTVRLRRAMPTTFAKKPKTSEKNNSTSSKRQASSDEVGAGGKNDDASKASRSVATKSTEPSSNSEKKRKLRSLDSIDRDYTVSENEKKSSGPAAQDVSVGILSDVANVVEKNSRMTYGHPHLARSKLRSKSTSSMELCSSKVGHKSGVALDCFQDVAKDFAMSLRDDSREKPNDEIPEQRSFPKKKSLHSFLADMKTSLTKLLGDIEYAQKIYFPNNESTKPFDVHKDSDKNSEVAFSDVNSEDCVDPLDLGEAFVKEKDAVSATDNAAVAEADATIVEKSAEGTASSDVASDATVLNLSPPRKRSGEGKSKKWEKIRAEKRRDSSSDVESDTTVLNLSPVAKKSDEEKSKNREKFRAGNRRDSSSIVKSAARVLHFSPRRRKSGEEKSKNREKIRGERRRDSSSDIESIATVLNLSPRRKKSGEEKSMNREKIRSEKRRDSLSDVESVATVLDHNPLRKKCDSPADQRHGSPDTVSNSVANDEKRTEKSRTDNDSGRSSDLSDADNARSRQAILMSSNSEDSSTEHRSRTQSSNSKESNDSPLNSSESDSNSERSSKSPERNFMEEESENQAKNSDSEKLRKKQSKFRLNKNRCYIADEKIKGNCEVRVTRLRDSVLERHSRALRKSRKYVESKEIQRLVALDHKKAASSSSEDEDSSKILTRNKKNTRAKKTEETLMDHLEKVMNGENMIESSESDAESAKSETKNKAKEIGDDIFEEANRMAKKRMLDSSESGAEEQPDSEDEKDEGSRHERKIVENTGRRKKKGRWRMSRISTLWIFSSDSDEECQKSDMLRDKLANKKKDQGSDSDMEKEESSATKKKRRRKRVSHSDSDSSVQNSKKKRKKKDDLDDDNAPTNNRTFRNIE